MTIREFNRDLDEACIRELGLELNGSFDLDKISKDEKILVCEKDGRIVGFIDYMQVFEVLEILYIVVDKAHRRCGVGHRLVLEVLGLDGVERSMLEVRSSNESAISFYKALGYKPVRVIRGYCSNGEDALAMEKVK